MAPPLTNSELERLCFPGEPHLRFLKNWRQILALIVVSRLLGTFAFNAKTLSQLDLQLLTTDLFDSSWKLIERQAFGRVHPNLSGRKSFVLQVCYEVATQYGVSAVQAVEKKKNADRDHKMWQEVDLSPEFIQQVANLLPKQPWPKGVHRKVSESLKCSRRDTWAAIQYLMYSGRVSVQEDGVVLNANGTEITVDEAKDITSE